MVTEETVVIEGVDSTGQVRPVLVDSTGAIATTGGSGGSGGGGDASAANQVTGNNTLSTINGKITAVNTGAVVIASSALPTGAATSAKQDTQITALATLLTGIILAAGENFIGKVAGVGKQVTVEVTRPANTTAYTAGDSVNNSTTVPVLMQFADIARVAGTGALFSGYLTGAVLVTDLKSITPRIRVHLYRASDPTISADNVAHKELYTELAKRIGSFDLPAMTTPIDTTNSTVSRAQDLNLRIPIVCGSALDDIWVELETLDAFTPASGQKFSLTLLMDQN